MLESFCARLSNGSVGANFALHRTQNLLRGTCSENVLGANQRKYLLQQSKYLLPVANSLICQNGMEQHPKRTMLRLIFEPTCAYARWALMHQVLSVCLSVCDLTKLLDKKSQDQNSDWTKSHWTKIQTDIPLFVMLMMHEIFRAAFLKAALIISQRFLGAIHNYQHFLL